MNKTVEISKTDVIVLTNNGVVVGQIKIKKNRDSVEFVGSAVNIRSWDYAKNTFHSFGCTGSITTDDANEVSTVEDFNNAMNSVRA